MGWGSSHPVYYFGGFMAQQQKVREKVFDHVLSGLSQIVFNSNEVKYLTPEFEDPICEEILLCFRSSFYICIAGSLVEATAKLNNYETRFRFWAGEKQSFINVSRNISNLYGIPAGGALPAIIDKQVFMQYKTAP
jgi:hypothetical protein